VIANVGTAVLSLCAIVRDAEYAEGAVCIEAVVVNCGAVDKAVDSRAVNIEVVTEDGKAWAVVPGGVARAGSTEGAVEYWYAVLICADESAVCIDWSEWIGNPVKAGVSRWAGLLDEVPYIVSTFDMAVANVSLVGEVYSGGGEARVGGEIPLAKVKSRDVCLDLAAVTVSGTSARFESESRCSSVRPVLSDKSASEATRLNERVLSRPPAARRRDPLWTIGAVNPADVVNTASSVVIARMAAEIGTGSGDARDDKLGLPCSWI
jgi:hypothetical protein